MTVGAAQEGTLPSDGRLHHIVGASPQIGAVSAGLATGVLFLYGTALAMPAFSWAQPVEIVHGVFLQEAILIGMLLVSVLLGGTRHLVSNPRVTRMAGMWIALGLCGVISAGANGVRFLDVLQALRLVLVAGLLASAYWWARARGRTFALRWYVFGIAVGGAANLYFTISQPELTIDVLPVLRSRNGAGGVLGMAVVLSAWLAMERENAWDVIIAVLAGAISIVAVAISFSKTAILIGGCGLVAWGCTITHALGHRRVGSRGRALVLLLLAMAAVENAVAAERGFTAEIARSAGGKFLSFDLRQKYSGGDRYLYIVAVGEILVSHPLLGVSYGGFYDAITQTEAYQTGEMADEDPDPERRAVANPHNSFLYYAAANGIPGILAVFAISLAGFFAFRGALRAEGASGFGMWWAITGAYVIYGMTLPTLFNTAVLAVPVAAAFASAGAVWPRGVRIPRGGRRDGR